MKKNWFQILSLGLNLVLLIAVVKLYGAVEDSRTNLKTELQNMETRLENSVERDIQNIQHAITIERQLHSAFELCPTGLDRETRALLADFEVTLKAWSDETDVTLLLTQQDVTREIPLERGNNGIFAAPVALSADKSGLVQLSIAVTTGGVTTKENLGGWGDVSMLLPVQQDNGGGTVPYFENGVLVLGHHSAGFQNMKYRSVAVQAPEFRLYRNGERVQTHAAQERREFDRYSYDSPRLLQEEISGGDTVRLTFACRDEYGLHYEFILGTWQIAEDAERYIEVSNGGEVNPILTWE